MLTILRSLPVVLTFTPALANDCNNPTFSPSPKAPITVQSTAPAVADVTGILPGMTPDQVLEISKKVYGADAEIQTRKICFIVQNGGVVAKSPEFTNFMFLSVAEGANTRAQVHYYFSGPASGNQLVGIDRHLYYSRDKAPMTDDMVASLKAKYGEPSKDINNMTQVYNWFIGGNKLFEVEPKSLNTSLDSFIYSPNDVPRYAEHKNAYDVHIQAMLFPFGDDPALLNGVDIQVWSSRKTQAAQADKEAILGEINRLRSLPASHKATPQL